MVTSLSWLTVKREAVRAIFDVERIVYVHLSLTASCRLKRMRSGRFDGPEKSPPLKAKAVPSIVESCFERAKISSLHYKGQNEHHMGRWSRHPTPTSPSVTGHEAVH